MAPTLPKTRFVAVAAARGHEERCWHVAWSPDGTLVASASSDRTARIWGSDDDAGRGDPPWVEVARLDDAHERTVRCVAWSPCSRLVACASFDATTTVWRRAPTFASDALPASLLGDDDDDANDDDAKKKNTQLQPWEIVATLEGHENEVKGVSWNASSTALATCGRDKTVWIWDVADETDDLELLTVLRGHAADVKAVAFDPDRDDRLASASYDETVRIWLDDGDDWVCAHALDAHASTAWDCRWLGRLANASSSSSSSSSGGWLATCGADARLKVWAFDDATREFRVAASAGEGPAETEETDETTEITFKAGARPFFSLDAAPRRDGGVLLAVGCGDDALRLYAWDGPSSEATASGLRLVDVATRAHGRADVNCVRFNPTRPDLLASAGDDGVVRIWRLVGDDSDVPMTASPPGGS